MKLSGCSVASLLLLLALAQQHGIHVGAELNVKHDAVIWQLQLNSDDCPS
jgi:hypothetical protein